MNFIKKIKSNHYFKKLKNNKIKIDDIDEQYLTSEICLFELQRNLDYFKNMPNQYKNKEMCDKAVLEQFSNIKYVPNEYRDSKMYYQVIDNLDNFCDYISFDEICDELKRFYIDKAIQYNPNYILSFKQDDLLEYNWIEAISNRESLVFKLPDIYKNNAFFKKIIDINPSFISRMPLDQLSQNLFDLSFKKNPNLIKYFPDQYITREMAEYIRLYMPEYIKRIPLRYQER